MSTKKLGFSDSKGGSICEQQGIRVRFNINEAEEDRRTERGIDARRERKENKKMADQIREGRIRATLAIIRSNARSESLARLCRSDRRVEVLVNLLLDLFVGQRQTARQRLAAFRAAPQNQFTNLTPDMEASLIALQVNPRFSTTFSAYLPSTVITSEDSSDDSSTPTARRARRRRRRRQRQEIRQDEENRRRAKSCKWAFTFESSP
ncbi:hypothetical protein SEMRO_1182_G249930.1 [Seminavis robusta]|uniref:Uncharacterized protein n=1 Tax=Seminavis robusta TaxID=568900 RepID=A0A9N8ELL0_9STRA|nr:hypothetical protein SEMRO_1182_G249930.1 [Seminavis robusta]|eukprot:Sro1182_g249930.1 n/a (207) ;mRNA; r:14143-14763